jgi:hypothetical protein
MQSKQGIEMLDHVRRICQPLPEVEEILLQQGQYYKTPYIGQHGWVSIKSPPRLGRAWRFAQGSVFEGCTETFGEAAAGSRKSYDKSLLMTRHSF